MDIFTQALLLLSVTFAFGTFIAGLFTLYIGKTFLQKMGERDARWEERVAALPADVTGARMIEVLEKHGIHIPPPLPVMEPEEVIIKVKQWCLEGVKLADQQKMANPKTTRFDKFATAKRYVEDQLKLARLEFPDARRLALFIEQAVSEWYRR